MINIDNNLFTLPVLWQLHLMGQFLDSSLIIYTLQKFFGLKSKRPVSPRTVLPVSLPFMLLLAAEDILLKNNFWGYAAMMIFLPLAYACIFCQGGTLVKTSVILTIFTLVSTLEDLSSCFVLLLSDGSLIDSRLLTGIFIFRRILSKGIVLLIVNKLVLSMKQLHTEIRRSYWIFLTAACIFNFCLCRYNVLSRKAHISSLNLLTALFSMTIPIVGCWLLRQSINLAEMGKVVVAQSTMIRMQKKNLEETSRMQDALREFRHDYQSHLFCMNALLEQRKYEELRRYLEKLQGFSLGEMEITPYTGSDSLNMILSQKKKEAERRGVDFQILAEMEAGTENGNIEIYDLNVLLSNLCSNAIEAALQVTDGHVRLKLMRKKAYLKIEIENSTKENVLETNPELITSKANRETHGLGLRIIENVVEKYDGMLDRQSSDTSLKVSVLLMAE